MKKPHLLTSLFLLVFILLLLFLSPSSSNLQQQQLLPRPCPQGLSVDEEEKTRLGSTPPRCYRKCNDCHPCMAVQVPIEPIRHRIPKPRISESDTAATVEFLQPSDEGRSANYKPLGWKCRCNNHFFNP